MTDRPLKRSRSILRITVPILLALSACAPDADTEPAADPPVATLPPGAQAISMLGDTLMPQEQPEDVRAGHMERYREAEDALVENPEDVDALIWMGRRTAYLGQYREAIEIYTRAIALHPEDARLYRHRGHRYLSVREFDRAIADFQRAAQLTEGQPDQVEPDGLPNRLNIPTSTLQFNIWYHLALAHYVQGDFEQALEAQRACLAVSVHPDSVVATSYWLYMTLKRLGMDEEAAEVLERISADMEIIESVAYLDLLLLFKGEKPIDDFIGPEGEGATLQGTTAAYGLGVWHLLQGRTEEAHAIWEEVLEGRNQWSAFGYIASEGELARAAMR